MISSFEAAFQSCRGTSNIVVSQQPRSSALRLAGTIQRPRILHTPHRVCMHAARHRARRYASQKMDLADQLGGRCAATSCRRTPAPWRSMRQLDGYTLFLRQRKDILTCPYSCYPCPSPTRAAEVGAYTAPSPPFGHTTRWGKSAAFRSPATEAHVKPPLQQAQHLIFFAVRRVPR